MVVARSVEADLTHTLTHTLGVARHRRLGRGRRDHILDQCLTLVTANSLSDCLVSLHFSRASFAPRSTPRPSPRLSLLFPLLSHQLRLLPPLSSILRRAREHRQHSSCVVVVMSYDIHGY